MRQLSEADDNYLRGGRVEMKRLLTALDAADVDAPAGRTQAEQDAHFDRWTGRIVATIGARQLQDILVDLQQQRLADVQAEIIAAFTPFFDSTDRCRIAAQNTDAFGHQQRRLSAIQRGDVASAKAAVALIDEILGAE